MPEQEIHTINIANGFTAKVLLQLPPNIDRKGNTKYPMLVDVYGGPDSYSVTDKWGMDWGTYLSSNQSVIYAKIDGRGSGLRGDKLLHSIYLKLGTVEITDQIEVARFVKGFQIFARFLNKCVPSSDRCNKNCLILMPTAPESGDGVMVAMLQLWLWLTMNRMYSNARLQ